MLAEAHVVTGPRRQLASETRKKPPRSSQCRSRVAQHFAVPHEQQHRYVHRPQLVVGQRMRGDPSIARSTLRCTAPSSSQLTNAPIGLMSRQYRENLRAELVDSARVACSSTSQDSPGWSLIDAMKLRRRLCDHLARSVVAEDERAAGDQHVEERRLRICSRHVATESRGQIPELAQQPGELHVRQPDLAERSEDCLGRGFHHERDLVPNQAP